MIPALELLDAAARLKSLAILNHEHSPEPLRHTGQAKGCALCTDHFAAADKLVAAARAVQALRSGSLTVSDPGVGVVRAYLPARDGAVADRAVREARTALGLLSLAYTDPTLVVEVTLVRRLHVSDVRTGVK